MSAEAAVKHLCEKNDTFSMSYFVAVVDLRSLGRSRTDADGDGFILRAAQFKRLSWPLLANDSAGASFYLLSSGIGSRTGSPASDGTLLRRFLQCSLFTS
jgi:hypothetical protein